MKKKYQKPLFAVEYYTLTQSVAACSGIKIGFADSNCVEKDPDATDLMKDWAALGGFINSTVSSNRSCDMDLSGFVENSLDDLICYFTSINAAFIS